MVPPWWWPSSWRPQHPCISWSGSGSCHNIVTNEHWTGGWSSCLTNFRAVKSLDGWVSSRKRLSWSRAARYRIYEALSSICMATIYAVHSMRIIWSVLYQDYCRRHAWQANLAVTLWEQLHSTGLIFRQTELKGSRAELCWSWWCHTDAGFEIWNGAHNQEFRKTGFQGIVIWSCNNTSTLLIYSSLGICNDCATQWSWQKAVLSQIWEALCNEINLGAMYKVCCSNIGWPEIIQPWPHH